MSPKDLNTCLHEDPKRRFVRVGKGTWTLASRVKFKRGIIGLEFEFFGGEEASGRVRKPK
jgi:hypothetical protein